MSTSSSQWKTLLDLALPALDHVFPREERHIKVPHWTLGGGTAIAIQIKHRISFDIDIFVSGTLLKAFTPAQNPGAQAISNDFEWPGHYIKFNRPEGEIDFLNSPLLTKPGFKSLEYKERTLALETLEEVITKKLRYRAASFKLRDVFDLAAVGKYQPGLAQVLAEEVPDVLDRAIEATEFRQSQGIEALAKVIIPGERTKDILPDAFIIALDTLHRARDLSR
jgi:hypothetical protein